MKKIRFAYLIGFVLLNVACGLLLPGASTNQPPTALQKQAIETSTAVSEVIPVTGESATAPAAAVITHLTKPSDSPLQGKQIYDVESSGTAPEKRSPYGDSYAINRFERPFSQDMTYLPDIDIATYNVSQDDIWVYVSIELIGTDPNNSIGINYGVEIDLDNDGFGDFIIWGNPPYASEWTTDGVQIFEDKNHDTSGRSAERSDAPFQGDGYETLIFDAGIGNDPDLAWARINTRPTTTMQFAFKKSLADSSFMLGVLADAGLKDVTKLDYNDRFSEGQAGSPERSEKDYPLKALYAVDNVCRAAIGFAATGNEPQGCPQEEPAPNKNKPGGDQQFCPPPPGCTIWDPIGCQCNG
jgi:hypothetical protein